MKGEMIMENPAELIRRAQGNARPKPASERPYAPPQRPVSHHSVYTGLMQKHDRVRTQHLGGQRSVRGA